ncbi:MAG: hypothetical protein KGI69_02790 [Patescibacteria group bacterium]|nr:hypothetical protein [Patescibacteria group bacterium]
MNDNDTNDASPMREGGLDHGRSWPACDGGEHDDGLAEELSPWPPRVKPCRDILVGGAIWLALIALCGAAAVCCVEFRAARIALFVLLGIGIAVLISIGICYRVARFIDSYDQDKESSSGGEP